MMQKFASCTKQREQLSLSPSQNQHALGAATEEAPKPRQLGN